jgi:hypothetical protein
VQPDPDNVGGYLISARSFDEYRAMFAHAGSDLSGSVQGSAAPRPRRFPATSSPTPHAMCPHRCPGCRFPVLDATQ